MTRVQGPTLTASASILMASVTIKWIVLQFNGKRQYLSSKRQQAYWQHHDFGSVSALSSYWQT